jgi:hypothetical protein
MAIKWDAVSYDADDHAARKDCSMSSSIPLHESFIIDRAPGRGRVTS